jgi:soluble lytic murein transglycosylase
VTREHPLSWHRMLPVAVVVALALVAVLAIGGPRWLRRLYHPLQYESLIASESKAAGLDPYLVAAVINVESGFREDVTSEAGAVGLMQVIPSTAHAVASEAGLPERVTAQTLERPGTNVRVGTRYLAYLVKRYEGDTEMALAAYNAGMTNVDKWVADAKRTGTPFDEAIAFPATRHYVAEVDAQAKEYRDLYPGVF